MGKVFDFRCSINAGPLPDQVTGNSLPATTPVFYRQPGHSPGFGQRGVAAGQWGGFHGNSVASYAPGTNGFTIKWDCVLSVACVPTYEIICDEYDGQSGKGYQLYLSYGAINGDGLQKAIIVLQADDGTQVIPTFEFPHKRDGLSHEYELIIDRVANLATLKIDNVPVTQTANTDLSSLSGKSISSPKMNVLSQQNGSYYLHGTLFKLEKYIP